jgi:hypothetical protein
MSEGSVPDARAPVDSVEPTSDYATQCYFIPSRLITTSCSGLDPFMEIARANPRYNLQCLSKVWGRIQSTPAVEAGP